MGTESKKIFSLWLSAKFPIGFSRVNDCVKYELQKILLSHTHVIESPISNDYIELKLYEGNGREKTEI